MRCHFSDKDETISDPSGLNIWTSVQNPCVLESVENLSEIDAKPCSDAFSTLYSLDSVSQTYKRKILECEKDDFEERFSKVQRKRQMLRTTARANLVIDDDDDDDLDDGEIHEEMELIEGGNNAMTFHLWKDNAGDLSFQSINSGTPFMYIPKLNWREERRHLLRISMAKIRCVDDPETYLLRSVLINNTVKRLQKDVGINFKCQSLAASPFYDSVTCENEYNNWDLSSEGDGVIVKQNYNDENGFQYSRYLTNSDTINTYNYPDVQTTAPYNFHLSVITPYSTDKTVTSFQNDMLQNSILPKSLEDEENVYDPSFSYRTLKQTNPVHMYSSQPCGLQYRNTLHEDSNGEYSESSSSSSLLDSVVYHSLIASLET